MKKFTSKAFLAELVIILVFLLVLYGAIILFIFPFLVQPKTYELVVDSFNKIGIGIGALIAGLAGVRYLDKEVEKEDVAEKVKKYREEFPLDEFGTYFDKNKKYFLARNDSGGDEIYIAEKLDTDDKLKRFKFYHIGNRYTFRDLFLGTGLTGKIQSLMDDYFTVCDYGEPLLTRGELGE
jgi:hypothetical protein